MIAETYYRPNPDGSKDWINPADVEVQRDERGRITGATLIADGQPVVVGGTEDVQVEEQRRGPAGDGRHGADTVRLFSMFAAPPEQSLEWNEAGVDGMARFLRRLWAQVQKHAPTVPPRHWIPRRWMPTRRRCAARPMKPSARSVTTMAAATASIPRSLR